jgi:hypothetical protein
VYYPFFIIIQSLENKIFDFRKRNSCWHVLFNFLDSFYLGSTLVMMKVTYDRNINIFSFVPWSLQYQKKRKDYIILIIESFPFLVILQHTIQYLHVEKNFKKNCVLITQRNSWNHINTRQGKHDKACFYFKEGSICKLLCWGGVPPTFKKYWWWSNQMAPSEK